MGRKGILAVKILGWLCSTAATAMLLMGVAGIWMKEGFTGVRETFSPFNIWNTFVIIITFAPGIAMLNWVKRKESARSQQERRPDEKLAS